MRLYGYSFGFVPRAFASKSSWTILMLPERQAIQNLNKVWLWLRFGLGFTAAVGLDYPGNQYVRIELSNA